MYRLTIESNTHEFDTLAELATHLKTNYSDPLAQPFSVEKQIDGEWETSPDPLLPLIL